MVELCAVARGGDHGAEPRTWLGWGAERGVGISRACLCAGALDRQVACGRSAERLPGRCSDGCRGRRAVVGSQSCSVGAGGVRQVQWRVVAAAGAADGCPASREDVGALGDHCFGQQHPDWGLRGHGSVAFGRHLLRSGCCAKDRCTWEGVCSLGVWCEDVCGCRTGRRSRGSDDLDERSARHGECGVPSNPRRPNGRPAGAARGSVGESCTRT